MKRPNSSDSLMGDTNGKLPNSPQANMTCSLSSASFPGAFFDDEMGCDGEDELTSQVGAAGGSSGMMGSCEKKRRLSVEQVKALEKNFEVENKLEPERKVKLAMELGLQPRQVAVWFQNRRARWKTKQLERDYSVLKSSYDSLKLSYDALRGDKDTLLAEIRELKVKLGMVKEESFVQEELPSDHKREVHKEAAAEEEELPGLIYKDGSSDSDSSAILNDENSPNHFAVSSSQGIFSGHYQLEEEEHDKGMFIGFQQYAEEKNNRLSFCYFPPQHARAEDHSLLGNEEPCGAAFFSDEPPAMPWYCSEQWS